MQTTSPPVLLQQQATAAASSASGAQSSRGMPLFPLINALQNLFLLLEDDSQFESLVEMEKLRRSFHKKNKTSQESVAAAAQMSNKENDDSTTVEAATGAATTTHAHCGSNKKRAPPAAVAAPTAVAAQKDDDDDSSSTTDSPSRSKKMKANPTVAAATTEQQHSLTSQILQPILYAKKPGHFQQLWNEKFLEVQKFKAQHGHLNLPKNSSLFHWLKNNKSAWKKAALGHKTTLTVECIEKLIILGVGTSQGPTSLNKRSAFNTPKQQQQPKGKTLQHRGLRQQKLPTGKKTRATTHSDHDGDGDMISDEQVNNNKLMQADNDNAVDNHQHHPTDDQNDYYNNNNDEEEEEEHEEHEEHDDEEDR